MSMIRFREWKEANKKKLTEMGEMPVSDPAFQIRQLERQLNDPRTPPQAKQQIMAQLQQLRGQAQPQTQPQTQPQQNGLPNAAAGQTSPSTAYKWVNGKPTPVNMNQA